MRLGLVAAMVGGCHVSTPGNPQPTPEPTPTAAAERAPPPASRPEQPDPGLVVQNRSSAEITLYAAYIVDTAGTLGTHVLWPHAADCPDVEPPSHTIPGAGVGWLPPPIEGYRGRACTPTPLPPGEYVVRLSSGYGDDLYAAAAVTLPLTAAVELELKQHDGPPPCDAARARRAAVLSVAAARSAGSLPEGFLGGCDLDAARCGTLPLGDGLPPNACTVTLHETLLRIDRPAGRDAIRSLEAWVDREVVYAQRPGVRATSASQFTVDGKPVVIAGITGRARHEHGGDAAKIGNARFAVSNPLDRDVAVSVDKVEFLTDHSCALPWDVRARPRVRDVSTKTLPPGRSEIAVMFDPQSAYQSHCDRFAARVTFAIAGTRAPVTVETQVARFDRVRTPR